jgi:hypothetical protein
MSRLLLISLLLFANLVTGQPVVYIHGKIVDERGKPVRHATLIYGDYKMDTVYSNNRGRFRLTYPNPHFDWFFLKIEKDRYLRKSVLPNITSKDMTLEAPILLRRRKAFWYDSKKIDSADIGITVKEAIRKFKLDIDMCVLWSEPPGRYHHFMAELSDSSYAYFTFKGPISKEKGVKMTDILDIQITGIGISFIDGSNKIFGDGIVDGNPYVVERRMKINPK